MKLTGRARMYARALQVISARENLRGRGASVERGARYLAVGIRLADELQLDRALKLAEPLALATHTPVVIAQRRGGLVVFMFQLNSVHWETYTRADLKSEPGRVGLGLTDGRRQVDFDFDPPHALVAGTTGSGKSETIKSLLCGLFTAHAPGDLQAAIVDPDGDHADDFRNVAHLNGLPVASAPEDIDNALAYAHAEYLARKRANDRTRPRFVLAIDEAEDALARATRLDLVTAIARHGRKYRVHLLLATQKPSERTLPTLLDKVLNRLVGLVGSAHISAHLTGQAGLDCHKLTGAGDFVHVAGARNERLLVALATRRDYERLPRAELTPPEIEFSGVATVDNDDLPDNDNTGPGRPREEVDPEKVAYYLMLGPRNISQRVANESLGLGKLLHYRHRDFTEALMAKAERIYQELRRANDGR